MKCQSSVLCLTSNPITSHPITNPRLNPRCLKQSFVTSYWFLTPQHPSETLIPDSSLRWVLMAISIKIFSLSKNIQHLDRHKQREFIFWMTLICDENPKSNHCQSLTENADLFSSVLYIQKYFMLRCVYLLFTSAWPLFSSVVCAFQFVVKDFKK